ncbi:putative integrase catalytic domain-containing protein [Phytophthora infestans]|uniref:Putative integrase catalytic domain-containing protein n=1 Tax=Phytophthora infestans TaxID=4787 RepID=A0A8S9TWI7_PHYIN|nr:putative integrase catalytic domain-containing protein [Phytophthora infestans]
MGTRQKLTIAFRQQANGITERVNQTIENYLRAFRNITSDNWDKSDIGDMPTTPAMSRTRVLVDQSLNNDEYKHANEFVEQQKDILARIRRQLQAAQDRMSQYYDRSRPTQEFAVGDRVLLSTNN